MKRLLLGIILLLAATAGIAQNRDVLLTPDGMLYTVDVMQSDDAVLGGNYLKLTARQGLSSTAQLTVPESMSGVNLRPALAYDDDSDTLFVLWLHQPVNSSANELYLASYHAGTWQPAVAIDSRSGIFQSRFNLRIAVTHRVAQLQSDGTTLDVPRLLVHAIWWEQNSTDGEGARYALVAIDKGAVSSPDIHALSELTLPAERQNVNDDFNHDFLRHPTIIENSDSNAVDVVFGDINSNTLNRVTLKPVADSRVHIPVGNRGGHPIAAPKALSVDWSGHATTLDGHGGRMMFVNTTADAVSYVSYANGKWTAAKTIATDASITTDAAMAAITKMLASE
jgi:hypothetical protein